MRDLMQAHQKIGTEADIPLVDVRLGGPVEHARRGREAMLQLRAACFSVVPAPLRGIAKPLDELSRAWLARSPSPYVKEIAAIAEMAGKAGVWFVNASYEWGCTTRIDVEPEPFLRRTLDWPFPGLGRHVQVAFQDGGAGCYANVTWPGAVGVLTAVAPGRFAAAINQAPLYRRTGAVALLPADFLLNGISTWRHTGRWPAAHLLRFVFDHCRTYDEAVKLLVRTPLARPTLFSFVGARPGQGCLIERTETEAVIHEGERCIANDWHPDSPPRPGRWVPRGRFIRGLPSSEERSVALAGCPSAAPFAWLAEPVLNGLTRIAVEASPASGHLRVVGLEPSSRRMRKAVPVTNRLDAQVTPQSIVTRSANNGSGTWNSLS
jgi:hypothetical protein